MLGLGMICWLILGSIMPARLLFRPPPPEPLLPTLAIEIAPAAVASLAYLALDGGRVDAGKAHRIVPAGRSCSIVSWGCAVDREPVMRGEQICDLH
jgi:tellurite resistance protein TehA-like permease